MKLAILLADQCGILRYSASVDILYSFFEVGEPGQCACQNALPGPHGCLFFSYFVYELRAGIACEVVCAGHSITFQIDCDVGTIECDQVYEILDLLL